MAAGVEGPDNGGPLCHGNPALVGCPHIKKRLTGARLKPVVNRRAITHGARALYIYTLTWCSLYQCFAALPPDGQLAYWYSDRWPVYTLCFKKKFTPRTFMITVRNENQFK